MCMARLDWACVSASVLVSLPLTQALLPSRHFLPFLTGVARLGDFGPSSPHGFQLWNGLAQPWAFTWVGVLLATVGGGEE